ncbi:Uncharacterised protein [Chlamydia trachomatis]|nr:Uncharacterised protein [Chlamydia trachomatis]
MLVLTSIVGTSYSLVLTRLASPNCMTDNVGMAIAIVGNSLLVVCAIMAVVGTVASCIVVTIVAVVAIVPCIIGAIVSVVPVIIVSVI